ncbi:hypothetical protein [Hoeflea marina]|nr:hypothetical protein [Hoeflea marina]
MMILRGSVKVESGGKPAQREAKLPGRTILARAEAIFQSGG